MKLVDSNIWLALALSSHDHHDMAMAWFADRTSSDSALFCRATQHSFLRLLTMRSLMNAYGLPPFSNRTAWLVYEDFRAKERVAWAPEPRGLETHWKKTSSHARPSPKLWMDAYLAAFAIASGYTFVTTDKAFRQFKGLDLVLLEIA